MSEITVDEKTKFWKRYFPKPSYRIYEIAEFLHCCDDTVLNQLKHYEIPMVRITQSPLIMQDDLIDFLIRAADKHFDELNNVGVIFCIRALKKRLETGGNYGKLGEENARNK